jgi:hypothetical protein
MPRVVDEDLQTMIHRHAHIIETSGLEETVVARTSKVNRTPRAANIAPMTAIVAQDRQRVEPAARSL